ncbi:MAG: hypothetical protein GX983_07860, partial [Corynebacterium sp.]|nr:hypothetical protein [Corynebacterium sp.]
MVLFVMCVVFVVWVGVLAVGDLRTRRLPDVLTLPGALVITGWAVVVEPWLLLGGVGWFLLYLVTAGVVGGIGGGDIKFALGLGTVAAVGSVEGWVLAVVGSSLLTLMLSGVMTSGLVAGGGDRTG